MPQLSGAGGGGDPELCATDEMIPFKDEGDPQKEKIFAEISHPEEEGDLADIKSSLVNESEIIPASNGHEVSGPPPERLEGWRVPGRSGERGRPGGRPQPRRRPLVGPSCLLEAGCPGQPCPLCLCACARVSGGRWGSVQGNLLRVDPSVGVRRRLNGWFAGGEVGLAHVRLACGLFTGRERVRRCFTARTSELGILRRTENKVHPLSRQLSLHKCVKPLQA